MEDELKLNTKLWGGIEGIIGRRDYFLNCVYIWIITTLLVSPYSIWLMFHAENYSDMFNTFQMFVEAPVFIKFFLIASLIASGVLYVSNIFRRLNDINGKVNMGANVIISLLMLLPSFAMFIPNFPIFILAFAVFIIGLVLLLKKGKITSKYPYDFTKEFNWGAFFGTWLWGLFNKSYIPLWMLILFFTPVGFYFQLICGIKGNEWAYKNKGWSDVEKFNKNQEDQTAIFGIISLFVVPALIFIMIIGVIFYVGTSSDPDVRSKLETAANYISDMAMSSFDSYEITEDENIFYVSADTWEDMSLSEKKDLLEFAARKAAEDRKNALPEDKYKYYSKMTELPRTKIYETETHVLLAEFKEPNLSKDSSFKDYFKAALNSYKFYKAK